VRVCATLVPSPEPPHRQFVIIAFGLHSPLGGCLSLNVGGLFGSGTFGLL
jgi:hypothetical protein